MFFSPKTSADGLVFHYDTGNTTRSYIGEPTTNLVTYSEYQYLADGFSEALPGWDTHQGTLLIDVNNKVPGFTNRSIKLTCIQANVYKYHFSVPLTSGQTYTISFWAKAQTAGNYDNFMLADGPGGYLVVQPSSITALTTQFTRVKHTFSMAARDTGTYNFATYLYGDGQIAWLSGFQLENTSHATQYLPSDGVATTRSATQGLKDLTAVNTIDLSTVSFDANAQMVFDGTDDFVDIGNLGTIGSSYSLECVFKSTSVTSYKNIFDMNYATYSGVTGNTGPRLEQISGQGISVIWSGNTTNNGLNNSTPTLAISANTYYHLAFVQNGTFGAIYLNGTLRDQVSNGQGYLQTFGDFNIGRGFILDPSRYASGNVDSFKIYNRALTADEVARNFNAVKSRFNIA